MRSTPSRSIVALTSALSLATSAAHATWSVLITDTRTGEIVLGSATCLTSVDLAVETPLLLTGIGAITAQSSIDQGGRNRMFIRDRLLEGQPLSSILGELESYDDGHTNRQYGMVTTTGEALTYSGIDNADWAGGITGRIEQGRPGPLDDIVYSVQGNILTGQPVVQAAVDAIINTDSDLPGKLMAAMLAARVTGGDGRCSCSSANPTGCGPVPPMPFKSAHVGYMIGSRADDTDAIRGFYELGSVTTGLTTLDLNDDGLLDYAVTTQANTIELFVNATNQGDQVAHFNPIGSIETTLTGLTKVTSADLDHDGLDDLITLTGPSTVAIFKQTKLGQFDPPILVPFASPIGDIEPVNINALPGDQLVLTFPALGSTSIVKFNNGTLELVRELVTGSNNSAAALADINSDASEDLLLVIPSGQELRVDTLDTDGNTIGSFALNTSANPKQVRIADINDDDLPDILVATTTSRVVDCFINTGTPGAPSYAPKVSSPINGSIIDFNIADMNNDGIQDIVAFTTDSRNIQILAGDNTGSFSQIYQGRLQGGPTTTLVEDLNGDGDLDIIADATDKLLILDNVNPGTIPGPNGFARGRKFMFINIANANAGDDDPVDQMLVEFQSFRDSLEGLPDAVQTTVVPPSRVLIDGESFPLSLRIEVRDWESNLITDPVSFTLGHDPSNLNPGPAMLIEPGIYEIPLAATSDNGATPGRYAMTIQATVEGSGSSVTLMPSVTIATTDSIADMNADGFHDFLDLSIFARSFISAENIADLNGDGLLTGYDITLFLSSYGSAP